MSDQPVTPDREALGLVDDLVARAQVAAEGHRMDIQRGGCTFCAFSVEHVLVMSMRDALLPLLTDALDRARQQGRDELMAEQRADADEFMANLAAGKVRLARGGPNRKAAPNE